MKSLIIEISFWVFCRYTLNKVFSPVVGVRYSERRSQKSLHMLHLSIQFTCEQALLVTNHDTTLNEVTILRISNDMILVISIKVESICLESWIINWWEEVPDSSRQAYYIFLSLIFPNTVTVRYHLYESFISLPTVYNTLMSQSTHGVF